MIKRLALSIVILLLMAPPFAARERQPNDKLVIAISTDFQPFTFLNVEGEPAGMFVDFWRLWAQRTGRQIEFISSDWNTSLENLKDQKADIHSGLIASPERSDWISSGFQPLYEVGISLFYPLKQGSVSDMKELSGQTVAAVRGSQPERFLKENYPAIRVLGCDTRDELVKVSREGKAKGFIAILPVGTAAIERMGLSGEFETLDKILYTEEMYPGVPKENTELLALVTKGFNAISQQELAEIEARWVPDPVRRYRKTSNVVQLTPAEEAWLKSHKTVKVGMSPVFPPLKFSEKGVIKGIEPDYLDLLSEYTGIQFEYVICDFALMDAKVKSGEIDMFLSFIIPERLGYMTFTEPFMEFKQVIVARSDAPFMSGIGALKGKKMATVKGVRLYDKLLGPYPEIETVPVQTMEEMFKVVAESKADALISKTFYAGYVINNYPNLKIAGIADLPPEPYLYAVRKDYPELVGILNKAIAFIPKDRVDSTIQKWFSIRLEYRANWSEILKWALVIAGAFAFILGLSFLWNRRLAREVDKRRQAEEILRGSQSLLNEMGKLAKIGGWEFDVETQEQEWTDEVYRIHEVDMTYKPTVSKGIDFYAPTSRPIIEKVVQRAVEQGEPFDVELELITAKGNPRWVHAIGRAHREGGKTSKVFGFLQDVTERRRAEEALRRQSDFLRSVIDSLGHPFYVIDVGDYSIKLVNKFASVTLPEAITCHALTHGRDKPCHGPEHNCPIEEVKRTGQPAVVEHVHRDAAGHERHLEIQAHPVFDNQGNVVQLIEYAVDITDRKRAEEKVHASLREKELLLGEIHHRVKNNLQIIVSLLNMQSRQPGHEDLEVLFQETRDRIRAMASVHALLYRSQNFAGIDFGEYIRETAGYLLRAYKKSTARISLIIHAENVTLSIDQAIPCGLITNELITNALKHAFPEAAEGELEIGMAETGEGIRLTVKDNGVGFPPDMDFRNSETMGLRLVNMLVKQLGGAIEQVMDGGTTYSIVFRPRPIALEVQHAGQSHHDCGR